MLVGSYPIFLLYLSAYPILYIMQWVRICTLHEHNRRPRYAFIVHRAVLLPYCLASTTIPPPLQKNKHLICCSHNNMLYIHLCRFYMVLHSSFRFCFCVYMCRIHGFLLCIYPSVRVSFLLTPYYYFYLCITLFY